MDVPRVNLRTVFRSPTAAGQQGLYYASGKLPLGSSTGVTGGSTVSSKRVAIWSKLALLAAGTLVPAGLTAGPSYAADDAKIYIVQGLPGKNLDIAVDGKTVAKNVRTAAVVGPFLVKGGSRKVTMSDAGKTVLERVLSVKAKSSWDVVVHLPAPSSGAPAVTVFKNDMTPVPKGKAALTVAHTAAVPPADIRVNGKVEFAHVANGESLNLVVPVATYKVAIVPAGKASPVYLGPLSLTVEGGALNRVYAVGDPGKKTMNIALHVLPTGTSGSGKPTKVDTGTGGQAVGDDPSLVVSFTR